MISLLYLSISNALNTRVVKSLKKPYKRHNEINYQDP